VVPHKKESANMLKLTGNKPYFEKALCILIIFLFSLGSSSFISPKDSSYSEIRDDESVKSEYTEPIKFDFDEILKRGTIRMITQYKYSAYFLYQGIDRGFEYELISRFAREHGLKVEVVLTHFGDDAIEMLNRGEGDLIAKNFAITSDRVEYVAFSRPYDVVNRLLGNQCIYNQNVSEGYASNVAEVVFLEKDSIAWAMRENAPVLKQMTDEYLQKHFRFRESDGRILRSAYLNQLRHRYFEDDNWISRFRNPEFDTIYTGYLSPYDEMIKHIAKEAKLDWKLVVAVMAHESAFNPDAVSEAGALGLMQIIPRFSLVENKDLLYDPETNIREGVRYLRKHLNNHAHLDSLNRYSMALATYNVGSGNISDAKQLAAQLGNNPNEWTNIAEALLKLMHPEYYKDARFGYKRGTETVNYVKDILNRYNRYHTVYQWAEHFEDQVIDDFMLLTVVKP
jgi:membrane-bound lytic murein transglycosylase MltF